MQSRVTKEIIIIKPEDNPTARPFQHSCPSPTRMLKIEAQQALTLLHHLFPEGHLSNVQALVFTEAWQGKTYHEIAETGGYAADYIKDVGHKLWRSLSNSLEEPVSKQNLHTVLSRHFQRVSKHEARSVDQGPSQVLKLVNGFHQDIPKVPIFIGRTDELSQLEQWIVQDRKNLLGIFGLGGIGKTALAVRLVERVQNNFEHVIWTSLRNTHNSNDFAAELIQHLNNTQATNIIGNPDALISNLINCLKESRCLVIIDNCFPIFYSNALAGSYKKNHALYGLLLRQISESRHQSCVLITSREKPRGLAFNDYPSFSSRSIYLRDLQGPQGQKLLRILGISDKDNNLKSLINIYGGHPYALIAASQTIIDLFNGEVSNFIDNNELIYGNIRHLIDQQFNRLSTIEKSVLFSIKNGGRSISLSKLKKNIYASRQENLLLESLESLYHRSFIYRQGNLFYYPPIINEYLQSQFINEFNSLNLAS
jgi:hypothetical protein